MSTDTVTPARFTPTNAPRIAARAADRAASFRAQADAATDPAERDALTRIAESHERIAARATTAAARLA